MTDVLQRINRLSEPQRNLLRHRLTGMRGLRTGESRLVGYVVPHEQGSMGAQDLRGFLRERLPDYMVPSAWVLLEAFPLTSRGKVDRKALLNMARAVPESGSGPAAPRNEHEQAIANIWEEVLDVRAVGIHDNFFDLGGHSLLLPKVLTKVRAMTGREVSMVDLFRYPTVHALAAYLAGPRDAAVEGAGSRRLKETRDAGVRRMKQRRAKQSASRNE